MLGVPGRRVDRLLQVHAGMDMAQEELRDPLVLLVAAGRAPGEVGLAVAQRHGRRERRARPLAGLRAPPDAPPPARTSAPACRGRSRAPGSPARTAASRPRASPSIMLPSRSMMSKCTVSPRTHADSAPSRSAPCPVVAFRRPSARRRRCAHRRAAPSAARSVDAACRSRRSTPGRSSSEARRRRSACGARRCRRPTAASRSARRRSPGRRRTSRGRRRRAWPPRPDRWMKSGPTGSSPSRSKPLSSASCCSVARPWLQAPGFSTV